MVKQNDIDTAKHSAIKNWNEAVLYQAGYEYSKMICDEVDQLKAENPSIQLSDSMNEWFDNFLNEQDEKFERQKKQSKRKLLVKKAAIFTISILAFSITITMGIEAFRLPVLNMLKKENLEYSSIVYVDEEQHGYINELSKIWNDFYYPIYLPEGYYFSEEQEGAGIKIIEYKNGENEIIKFSQHNIETYFQVDTEDAKTSTEYINGNEGIYILKDGINILVWNNGFKIFSLESTISKEELLQLAQSMEKK